MAAGKVRWEPYRRFAYRDLRAVVDRRGALFAMVTCYGPYQLVARVALLGSDPTRSRTAGPSVSDPINFVRDCSACRASPAILFHNISGC
jgi:hypothetical protein